MIAAWLIAARTVVACLRRILSARNVAHALARRGAVAGTEAKRMQVFTDHRDLPPIGGAAVTIGNFDGLHQGHRALVDAVGAAARDRGLRRAVLTFEPHPAELLAPGRAPVRIAPPEEKLRLLAAAGIDLVVAQRFEPDFAGLSPQAFIEQVLVDGLRARHVVVGYDFGFGRRRAGDVNTLRAAGQVHGFTVQAIEAQRLPDGSVASSTAVRSAVQAGDLAQARTILGRWYSLTGTVVTGDQRGRGLGFPTANVESDWALRPALGVYGGWLEVDGVPARAVINVGRKPTFGDYPATIEAHVLGAEGLSLYGRSVRVWFATRLRAEQRFANLDALVAQIAADAAEAGRRLALLDPP